MTRRRLLAAAAAIVLLGFGAFWLLTRAKTIEPSALPRHAADLSNGRTMFFAGGCPSCHAVPKQEDHTLLGGGLGLKSPFGTFYVPNISPDPDDGIGRWTDAQFATALLKGVSPAGEHYYPSFPYTSYQRMRPEDVVDLFAFLKTLPPVKGRVRAHDLPFPFTVRRGLGLWKLRYLDGKPFSPDPAQSAEWNRGAYLVNGLSHCAECHSPRDPLGGIRSGQRFTGGPNPEGEGWVPNITQAGRLRRWSEMNIAEVLASGDLPNGDSVGSSMVAVVRNTSQLPPADRKAMAGYIKSLPAVEGAKPPSR